MTGMLNPMELEPQPQSMFGGRRRRGSRRRMGRSIMSEFQRQGRSQGQGQGQSQGQQGGVRKAVAPIVKRGIADIKDLAVNSIKAVSGMAVGSLRAANDTLTKPSQKGGKSRRRSRKSRKHHKRSHRRN
jgi:hypothetical protein